MEIDLEAVAPRSEPFRACVCVVGAGIAGLTLAQRLAKAGIDVALVEAGGALLEERSQAVFHAAQQVGARHRGLRDGRFRALGGSSIRWGGQVLPMSTDASTWPVPVTELDRYMPDAQRLMEVDDLPFEGDAFFGATGRSAPQPIQGVDLRVAKWAPFSRRNLANTVARDIIASPRTTLYLHANVTELVQSRESTRVVSAVIRNYAGQRFELQADHFILATGTIETSRLLLASRTISERGTGNEHDQVGRNFHDHLSIVAARPTGTARERLLRDFAPYVFGRTVHTPKLIASSALCGRLGCGNILAHLTLDEPELSGVAVLREVLQSRQRGDLIGTLRRRAGYLPASLMEAGKLLWCSKVEHRRYVSPRTTVTVRLNAEQQLDPGSRITLGSAVDAIGMPIAVLDWKISHSDVEGFGLFAGHLRQQLPWVDWQPDLSTLEDVFHPMGGTLMGTDPRSSVVDPDLAVHGMLNLHIASASTFPAGGSPLPTLTLMALSLRLADRLANRLRS